MKEISYFSYLKQCVKLPYTISLLIEYKFNLRVLFIAFWHGCQIFCDTKYQNDEKTNVPNRHKIKSIATKYNKWS
jgi:hypothetical protein